MKKRCLKALAAAFTWSSPEVKFKAKSWLRRIVREIKPVVETRGRSLSGAEGSGSFGSAQGLKGRIGYAEVS
jgi:hypothetical protein